MTSEIIVIPAHWPEHHNANTAPCDIINGPCACGAWHTIAERWVAENIRKFGIEQK